MRRELLRWDMRQQQLSIDEHRMAAGRILNRNAAFAQAFAEVFHLIDAISEVILVGSFFQADSQRLHIASRQAAVGDKAFHRHAADAHFVEEIFVIAEAAQAANIHHRVFLGGHGQHIAVLVHLKNNLFHRFIGVALFALFNKPGVFAEAGGVDHHRNIILTRNLIHLAHIRQRYRLAAGAVTGDGGNNRRHVFRAVFGDGRFQQINIKVAFPVVPRGGVEGFRRHHVNGFRAVELHVRGGGIEVEVGNKHRMRRLAASNQAREQNLLRAAPLVGGNGIGIADNLFDLFAQMLIVTRPGVGFVAHHQPGPLMVAHRAGAGVGQQVDIHVLAIEQKRVIARLFQRFDAIVKSGHTNVFDHFNAERLRDTFHLFSPWGCCAAFGYLATNKKRNK